MISRPPISFKDTVEKIEYVEKFNFKGYEVSYHPLKDSPDGGGSFKWVTTTKEDGSAVMEKKFIKWEPTATRCDVVAQPKRRPSHLREPYGPERRAVRSKINEELLRGRYGTDNTHRPTFRLKTVPQGWLLYAIPYTPVPQWALNEYLLSIKFSTNPGFRIMDKMGWVPNTPLGIRGCGITEPITHSESSRIQGSHYEGLGYKSDEDDFVFDTKPTNEFIQIISVGEHYGVALWNKERVFVPKGALKHLKNILWYPIDHVGVCVMADMVIEEGKRYKWRVTKIREVVFTMF